ncbi:hypothetical protein J5N97_012870 [Dioscorea zingiberensis]|uniref:DC-UbP/UBTD2 N-terminal domain-containing protein n=1 Tax=Dioscorea zingiberensis TaxID=325984 RepID=A0A9D5CQ16_9LILI|nr:hypothetical protein J5N97_012870 [Dioscorea zingiberensis]
MRDEFWDIAPHYGGQKEIWDALRAAAEAELSLAQTIVDSAGIIVTSADMTTCYDERGYRFHSFLSISYHSLLLVLLLTI